MNPEDCKLLLEEALKTINWSIKPCGNDRYVLINNLGGKTDAVFHETRITIDPRKRFPEDKRIQLLYKIGYLKYDLHYCNISTEVKGCVSLAGIKSNNTLVSFMECAPIKE